MTLTSAESQRLLQSIDDGFSLPSQLYTDTAVFAGETERIMRRSWHYATDVGKFAEPGDQFLWNIGGVPIVLTRDSDGAIRGFVNICRHRAHPVVLEAGNRRVMQCHYHGWTYNLDGSLKAAPRSSTDPSFDPTGICLTPVQVATWGPMVWVNVDNTAPSLSEWTEGMNELMLERGCDVTQFVHGVEKTWEIGCNWKVFQDNTIECYHCPTTHPEFSRAVVQDPKQQELYVGGRYWIHHKIPFRKDWDPGPAWGGAKPDFYYYNWVFPTTYLQHFGRGFDIGTLEVIGVDRLRFKHITFLPPDTEPELLRLSQKMLDYDPTIPQDVDICNRVQHAHATGVAPPGRLIPQSEYLLSHFYRLVVELLTED
jgi:phenylpropionate dioxygenase-like ring-hydroxylating dioxygenase large terminal subunit